MKYSIQDIMEMLPHRFPMLLIDRIIEIEPDNRIKALKNVTINEPFFNGHFPDMPIMPGVLILEAMAQAGGILIYESKIQKKKGLIFHMAMDKVRFRQPVLPGDQLISEMTLLKFRKKAVKMKGTAHVGEKLAAEAEFLAYLGEETL
ncbi:MAG: 3-hydroxyacyl-ACP dehydratase FabZ [Desulfobacterales bacterium]|nr:3-hydroxyacyl-ACP dehydratase FabZ [Desulfobacterales bacterium]